MKIKDIVEQRVFNATIEINGKGESLNFYICMVFLSVIDGQLRTGDFSFAAAKKTCEEDGMTLPTKHFRFFNWESIDFGSYHGKIFARAAFWINADNSKYQEYINERGINHLVTLMRLNHNETHPLCAFLCKNRNVKNYENTSSAETSAFTSSFICEDKPFDDLGRVVVFLGDVNCTKMKLNSTFTEKYQVLVPSLVDKTWTIKSSTEEK